jgi:hypothetical protein
MTIFRNPLVPLARRACWAYTLVMLAGPGETVISGLAGGKEQDE